MATADELVTILGVEVSKETMQSLASFKAGIDGVVSKLNTLALAAGAVLTAAGFFVKGVMDEAGALATLSDKSGLSTDALQEWKYAADKAGLSAQAIQRDLVNLNKTMSSPIPGQFNVNFAMLGVSVRDANGALKSSDELLGDVADKMSGMSHQQAMQWGSKIGISDDTVLLLRQGKEGLEAVRKEAHEIGAIIPAEAIKRSEEFRQSLVKMQAAFRGISSTIAIAAMPALQRIVDSFSAWIQENRKWIALNTEAFMQGFVNAVHRIQRALQRVGEFLKPITDKFKEFTGGLDKAELYTHLLTGAILALMAIFSPFLAKAALISAAFTAIGYAIEDVFTFMEGGDSVIGRLVHAFQEAFPQWAEVLKTIARIVKELFLESLEAGWAVLKRVGAAVLEVFGAFGDAMNEVAGPLNEFLTTFEERFPAIVDAVRTVAKAITEGLGKALNGIVGLLKVLMKAATEAFKFMLDGLSKIAGAANKVLSWMGFGEDDKKGDDEPAQPQHKLDATRYAPAARQLTVPAGLTGLSASGTQRVPPGLTGRGLGPQVNDNRTINQQIHTSDPQQAADLMLRGIGAAPQINSPGLYSPVVR